MVFYIIVCFTINTDTCIMHKCTCRVYFFFLFLNSRSIVLYKKLFCCFFMILENTRTKYHTDSFVWQKMTLISCHFSARDVGRLLYLKTEKNYIFSVLKISYCFFVVDKMSYVHAHVVWSGYIFAYMYCVYKIIYLL